MTTNHNPAPEQLRERVYSKLDALLVSAAFRADKGWEAGSGFLKLRVLTSPGPSGCTLRFELRPDRAEEPDAITTEAWWLMLFDPDPKVSQFAAGQLELADYPLPTPLDLDGITLAVASARNAQIEQIHEVHFDRNGDGKESLNVPSDAWCMLTVPAGNLPPEPRESQATISNAPAEAAPQTKQTAQTNKKFVLREWIAVWPKLVEVRPRQLGYGLVVACLVLLMGVFISQYGAGPGFQVAGSSVAFVMRGSENLPKDHVLYGDFVTEVDFATETIQLRFPGDILYSGAFAASPETVSSLDPQEYFVFDLHRVGRTTSATNSWKGKIILQQHSGSQPLAGQSSSKPKPNVQSLRLEFTSVDGVKLTETAHSTNQARLI